MLLDISARAHYKSITHCTGLGPAAAVCVPAVVSGVICALLVGLLCGAGAASPAPLYDDIELVATTKQVEPPLQHNVAYGHVN